MYVWLSPNETSPKLARAYTPRNHRQINAINRKGDAIQGGMSVSEIDNYWKRRTQRNVLTRRRMLGGTAAAGLGAAALGLVGCGDDDDDNGVSTASPAASASAGASAAASPSAAAKQKGGTAHFVSAN